MQVITRLGGRKQLNGYLAAALFTLALLTGNLSGIEFVGAILGALGITSGAIAWEDRGRIASPSNSAAAADGDALPSPEPSE